MYIYIYKLFIKFIIFVKCVYNKHTSQRSEEDSIELTNQNGVLLPLPYLVELMIYIYIYSFISDYPLYIDLQNINLLNHHSSYLLNHQAFIYKLFIIIHLNLSLSPAVIQFFCCKTCQCIEKNYFMKIIVLFF